MKWNVLKKRILAVALAAAVAGTSFGGTKAYAESPQGTEIGLEEKAGSPGVEEGLEEKAESPDVAIGVEKGQETEAKAPEVFAGAESSAEERGAARDGAIAFNTRVDGVLESAEEEDIYVITPQAGVDQFYEFSFVNAGDSRMLVTISSDEHFAGQSVMESGVSSKDNGKWNLQKQLEGGKDYYIRVKCYYKDLSQAAPYYFQMDTTADDVKDTTQGAEAISLNQKVGKSIENRYDVDFFQFTTTSNPDTFYSLSFSNGGAEGNMYFTVYEDEFLLNKFQEVRVASGRSETQNLLKLLPNHTYYVKVAYYLYMDFIPKEMPYYLQVNSIEDDVLDDVGNAAALKMNQKVSKALQNKMDVDIYKLTTPDTDSFYWYEFTNVSSTATMVYSIFDNPELAGTPILRGTLGEKGNKKHELGKLKRKYAYYVKVEHMDYSNADNIHADNYIFVMTSLLDDVNNKINNGDDTAKNIRSLSIGKSLKAGIQSSGDVDYYKFTTTKDENFYELTMGNTGDFQINIQIWDNKDFTGQKLLEGNVSEKRSETFNLVKLEKKHTYYVRIAKTWDFSKEGKYTLKLNAAKDDVKDTIASAQKVDLNVTKTFGLQNEKDEDWFKFTTTDYDTYRIKFSNLTKDSSYIITIYDNKDGITNNMVINAACYGKQSLSSYYALQKLKRFKTYYVKITGNVKGKYKFGVDAAAPGSKIKKASKKVNISWSKVPRATGYEIWRAQGKNGAYKKIRTITKGSILKYTDTKGLKKGKTYFYKVRAYRKWKKKTYYTNFSSSGSAKI